MQGTPSSPVSATRICGGDGAEAGEDAPLPVPRMRSEIFRAVAAPGEQRGSILLAGKQRSFRDAGSGYGEPGRINPAGTGESAGTRGGRWEGLAGPQAAHAGQNAQAPSGAMARTSL